MPPFLLAWSEPTKMTPASKTAKICIQFSPSILFLFCLKKNTLQMQCCSMKFNEKLHDTVFSFILPFLCQTKAFFYLSERGNTNCALDVLLQSVLRKSKVLSEQKLKTERGKSELKKKCIYHKSLQFMAPAIQFGKVSVRYQFPFKTWLYHLVFHYSFRVCCSLSADLPLLGKA